MAQKAAVIFTFKSVETLLEDGGSSSWRLDRNHARQCTYAVCTRNANADGVQGPEAHRSAFLVGKISGVVPAPNRPGRYLIQFSEYARVDIPDVWKRDRNPIRYSTLEELGIHPAKLKWQPMPPAPAIRTSADRVGLAEADPPLVSYVKKMGDNFALLMSAPILEQAGLAEGSRVEVESFGDGRIIVRRSKRHFTIDELLAGMTPEREHPLEDDAPRGEETL